MTDYVWTCAVGRHYRRDQDINFIGKGNHWIYLREIFVSSPGHTHQGNQILKRHVYPSVHRITVYNSQDMEATRCPSADEWVRKLRSYTQWNITQPLKRIHLNQF